MKNVAIIDVESFFDTIIAGYTQFGHSAATLAAEISSLSPDLIQQKCRQLDTDRQRLAVLDSQLIDILNLAGSDLAGSDYVVRYRNAFSVASQAIEDIQCRLLSIRQSLQDVTRH